MNIQTMKIPMPLIHLVLAGLMSAPAEPAPAKSLWIRAEPAIAAAQSADAASEVVNKYIKVSRKRQVALRGTELEVDIHARLANLNRWSRLRAIRRVSCNGKISYQSLDSSGDNGIKQGLIARFLAADRDANENGAIAINTLNYEFRLKSPSAFAASPLIYVFQLRPRKKRVGLFKGEIRLDAATGMPVQESGQFVKNPSRLLKSVRFVRDYENRNGIPVAVLLQTAINTRLGIRAELTVKSLYATSRQCAECTCGEPSPARETAIE